MSSMLERLRPTVITATCRTCSERIYFDESNFEWRHNEVISEWHRAAPKLFLVVRNKEEVAS